MMNAQSAAHLARISPNQPHSFAIDSSNMTSIIQRIRLPTGCRLTEQYGSCTVAPGKHSLEHAIASCIAPNVYATSTALHARASPLRHENRSQDLG